MENNQKSRKKNNKITILNTTIDLLNMQETIKLVEQYILSKTPLHLAGVNADKILQINNNVKLKSIIDKCGIVNADGCSIVLASKFLNKPLPERIAGIDLMNNLIELCEKKDYSIYLLGAKQETVEKTANILYKQHPKLNISGIHDGYFNKSKWLSINNELAQKKPDIVFVGITSPIKEYIIEYFINNGTSSVFMGVGGSFDVISGNLSRAPIWMQKLNLEWLFRVMQEPKRLFKRYFIGNWKFIMAVFKEKYKNKIL